LSYARLEPLMSRKQRFAHANLAETGGESTSKHRGATFNKHQEPPMMKDGVQRVMGCLE